MYKRAFPSSDHLEGISKQSAAPPCVGHLSSRAMVFYQYYDNCYSIYPLTETQYRLDPRQYEGLEMDQDIGLI